MASEHRWVFPLDDMTKHLWAFFYFCKRRGDRVVVDRSSREVTITKLT